MTWFLSLKPPREPDLLNVFLLAVGKALAMATRFEKQCQYVLSTTAFFAAAKESDDWDAAEEFAAKLEAYLLGPAIGELPTQFQKLGDNHPLTEERIEVLRKAKAARNFIAHDSANIDAAASRETLIEQAEELVPNVVALAAGSKLVSDLAQGTQEGRDARRLMREEEYVSLVLHWVMGDGLVELPPRVVDIPELDWLTTK